jgi:putative phage-type endonuclease
MIIHRDIIQRTPEWDAVRLGRITASALADLMPAKSKPADSWTETQSRILYTIAAERMTGQRKDSFETRAIQWGRETEQLARAVYEIDSGSMVEEVGFIELDEWVGCSPDGLVDDDGLVELKCPNSDTHLQYRTIAGRLSDEYFWQVQGQLWISGRSWCDLCSFDPRFLDASKRLHVVRLLPDADAFERIAARVASAVEAIKTIMAA